MDASVPHGLLREHEYVRVIPTHQSHKVQQVHAWLVGLGVSQRQQGGELEAHSVARIASLKHTIQPYDNN